MSTSVEAPLLHAARLSLRHCLGPLHDLQIIAFGDMCALCFMSECNERHQALPLGRA